MLDVELMIYLQQLSAQYGAQYESLNFSDTYIFDTEKTIVLAIEIFN